MSPKVITGEIFKNRKEISVETFKELFAVGGDQEDQDCAGRQVEAQQCIDH